MVFLSIDSTYPTKLQKDSLSKQDWVKQRTLELYDFLPQTSLDDRKGYLDIRDAVLELNYPFFGYCAKHTFVNYADADYEDKFQSAVLHFCEIWHLYRFSPKYRTDLSFAVFFKPRISEMIRRELCVVKYTPQRVLCMKVAKEFDISWTEVTEEHIKKSHLSKQDLDALMAMINADNKIELTDNIQSTAEEKDTYFSFNYSTTKYNAVRDLLIHEMVCMESPLEDKDLLRMANLYDIPFYELKMQLPFAMETLHNNLINNQEIMEEFR